MKLALTAIALILSSIPAFADENVVKSCTVSMQQLDGGGLVKMTMEILSNEDGSVFSRISQDVNGRPAVREDLAQVSEAAVRENLSPEMNTEGLNQAELLIVHAMLVGQEPELAEMFSAGIDLKLVRSAKMYVVGETTNMGSATIVEAKDAEGKILGSFLGGFLVSPCL